MTHTPTPWGLCYHLRSPEHDASCKCGYRGSIWSADGEYIVLEMGSSPDVDQDGNVQGHTQPQADRPTQLNDAAFIVKAVNAYDALVFALTASTTLMAEYQHSTPVRNDWCRKFNEQIESNRSVLGLGRNYAQMGEE